MEHPDIHVAIPVHNNAEGLKKLLPRLLSEPFSSITVLDDASTDETPALVAATEGVKTVRSEINLGTVGANNLILKAMPETGYLLCIDSDMDIVTENLVETLQQFLVAHPRTGAGVGRVVNNQGEGIRWNTGYDLNPWRATLAFLTYHPAVLLKSVPIVGPLLRRLSLLFTNHLAEAKNRKIDWGIESFFFVRVDLWKELHGFDTRFKRFHEGPDLFLQIRKKGFETWFVADIVARDTDQRTGSSWFRIYHWWRSWFIYFYKNPSRLLMYRYPRP